MILVDGISNLKFKVLSFFLLMKKLHIQNE